MNTFRAGVLVLCIVVIIGLVVVSYATAATKVLPGVKTTTNPTVSTTTSKTVQKTISPAPTPKKVVPAPTPKKVVPVPTPKKVVPVPTPKKVVPVPTPKKVTPVVTTVKKNTPSTESALILGLLNTQQTSQLMVLQMLQLTSQMQQASIQQQLQLLNQRIQQYKQQYGSMSASQIQWLFSMKDINTLPKPCYKCSVDINKGIGQLLLGSANAVPGRGYNFSGIGGIGGIGGVGSGLLMFSPAPTGGTKAGDVVKNTGGGGGPGP